MLLDLQWRRYFWLLGFCVAIVLDQTGAQSMTDPTTDLGAGATFEEADQESSSDTAWTISLTVDIGSVTYNWLELKRRMYNGKITGPTITMKQGDIVTVNLINQLSSENNDLGRPLNQVDHPNSTNLHTHGLHISSQDPQDNVLKTVGPGTTNIYAYRIHDTQPAGTYWYHAHLHGSTNFQVTGGLSGMLIIEDKVADMPAELAAVSCPDNCDKDIQLLFQPVLIFEGNRGYGAQQDDILDYAGFQHDSYIVTSGGTLTEWLATNVNRFTTNGQLEPTLMLTTSQVYRFRMVNAGGDHSLELYIVGTDDVATSDCDIREIAIDGVYLDAPRSMHNGQTFVAPGSKVDWLVKCNADGTYKVRSFADASQDPSIGGFSRFTGDLATLNVATGTPVTQDFPSSLPTLPSYLSDLRNTDDADIGGRFVVELNPSTHLNRELWSGPGYYRYKMTVGTTQEWHLLNSDSRTSHPLHIHVNHFQIISYNPYTGGFGNGGGANWQLFDVADPTTPCVYQHDGLTGRKRRSTDESALKRVKRQGGGGGGPPGGGGNNDLQYLGHDERYTADAGNTLGYARAGEWRDTVLVPALANITVRFVAHEHVGDVIIHCHILDHEDSGMMMVTEVVAEGQSTEANIPSGNAYPGTCKECDRYPFNNSTTLCDSITPTVTSAPNNTSETTSRAARETLSFSVILAYVMVSFGRKASFA